MTKILVGGNNLRNEGTIILCDALRVSTVSKVQELGLSSNDIGPDGAKAVATLCAAMASDAQTKTLGKRAHIENISRGTQHKTYSISALTLRSRSQQ